MECDGFWIYLTFLIGSILYSADYMPLAYNLWLV